VSLAVRVVSVWRNEVAEATRLFLNRLHCEAPQAAPEYFHLTQFVLQKKRINVVG
jgi:hypothetical protein